MARKGTRRKPSISDVARVAGVAVGTVSNVLNRPEAVSPKTRASVDAAIVELGFVRNGAARQLRAGTVTTVGVILLDVRNPFFTDVARGIEDRLEEDDYTLLLASSDDDPARERKYLRLFEERGISGLLVVPASDDFSQLLSVQSRGVRVVLLDSPISLPDFSSVGVDNDAGGFLAASHLLDLGHEQITFLNGQHVFRQCADRRAGVDRAVIARGLDPTVAVCEILLDAQDASGGDLATQRLLEDSGGVPPDAIFCVNDLVAIGVQRALRKAGGLDLLSRVSLVGYDDIDIAKELAIPLTSVVQPTHDLGYRAADLLIGGDTGTSVEHVIFQPRLVVRESSQPGLDRTGQR